jgi:hypothetical protein
MATYASPFCMIWEYGVDNNGRKPCHTKFKRLADRDVAEAVCFCIPRALLPRNHRRHHQTAEGNMKSEFQARFTSMNRERDDKGERVNQLGRYPYPDCNNELVEVFRPDDYFVMIKFKKIITHMNMAHNASVVLRRKMWMSAKVLGVRPQ